MPASLPSGLSTKLMSSEDSGELGCMAGNNDKAKGQTSRCVLMCLRCCCCKCRPDHNNRFHLWRWRAARAADGHQAEQRLVAEGDLAVQDISLA